MRVQRVHLVNTDGKSGPKDYSGRLHTSAILIVPGLGEVNIQDCISEETANRVFAECEAALQQKLKGKIG